MRTVGNRLGTKAPSRLTPPPKVRDDHYGRPEHKAWAKAVIKRAGGCCQDCGATGKRLFADHIVELKDGGAKYDVDNGKALCGSCHVSKGYRARAAR